MCCTLRKTEAAAARVADCKANCVCNASNLVSGVCLYWEFAGHEAELQHAEGVWFPAFGMLCSLRCCVLRFLRCSGVLVDGFACWEGRVLASQHVVWASVSCRFECFACAVLVQEQRAPHECVHACTAAVQARKLWAMVLQGCYALRAAVLALLWLLHAAVPACCVPACNFRRDGS